jgi:hypothetical protein
MLVLLKKPWHANGYTKEDLKACAGCLCLHTAMYCIIVWGHMGPQAVCFSDEFPCKKLVFFNDGFMIAEDGWHVHCYQSKYWHDVMLYRRLQEGSTSLVGS